MRRIGCGVLLACLGVGAPAAAATVNYDVLLIGTVAYAKATFGPVVDISTDAGGRLTGFEFGSNYGGNRLLGFTPYGGWIFADKADPSDCGPGITPAGTNCIGGAGPRSIMLEQVTGEAAVPEPAALSLLLPALALLPAARRRRG